MVISSSSNMIVSGDDVRKLRSEEPPAFSVLNLIVATSVQDVLTTVPLLVLFNSILIEATPA